MRVCFAFALLLAPALAAAQWEEVWRTDSTLSSAGRCGASLCLSAAQVDGGASTFASFYTSPDGRTWTQTQAAPTSAYAFSPFVDAGGRSFVGYAGFQVAGVLVSDDDGASWQEWSNGLQPNAAVTGLVTDGAALYAASFAGAYRRGFGDGAWASITGFPANVFGVTEVAASGPDTLLAAAFGYGFGGQGAVYRSLDAGGSWAEQPLIGPTEAVNALVWTGTSFLASTNVPATDGGGRVYRSKDGQAWAEVATWTAFPARFLVRAEGPPGTVFASAGDALWASADDGRTWTQTDRWEDEVISILAQFDGALYVGLNRPDASDGRLLRAPLLTVDAEPSPPTDALLTLGPVSPNPSRGGAAADLAGPPGEEAFAEVFDLLGRRMDASALTLGTGPVRVRLPGDLPAGLYVLRVRGEAGTATRRFVVSD